MLGFRYVNRLWVVAGGWNMTLQKRHVCALLLTSALVSPASAGEWEVRVGGYYNAMVAYAGSDSGPAGDDFDGITVNPEGDLVFNPSITLDNGLRLGTDIDLDDIGDTTGISPDLRFISGNFGTGIVGNGTGFGGPNMRRPAGFPGGCGPRNGNTGQTDSGIQFDGIQIGSSYTGDLETRYRGYLAFDGLSAFVNPAVEFTPEYDGVQIGANVGFCADLGQIFPTYFEFGYGAARYSGGDQLQNLNFPNLGVTSPGGGVTGVLINSPTTLSNAYLDVTREGHGYSFNVVHPIYFYADTNQNDRYVARPSNRNWLRLGSGPSLTTVSLVGGLNYGTVEQTEMAMFNAFTPAFGANGNWQTQYDTHYDSDVWGADVGLSVARSFPTLDGATNTLSLTGTIGHDYYDIDVWDSAMASGLGGALNFANMQNHSYDTHVTTASLSAGYTWQKDRTTFSLNAGLQYGEVPTFDYHRVDSTPAGAPRNPVLNLEESLTYTVGIGFRHDF